MLARIQPGLAFPATRYLQVLQIRDQVMTRFVELVFSRCEALHLPVFSVPLPTLAETDVGAGPSFAEVVRSITHNTRTINYLGLPSLATPAGFTANGVPAAFQLVGRPFAEATLFRFAAAYEAATGWSSRTPEL